MTNTKCITLLRGLCLFGIACVAACGGDTGSEVGGVTAGVPASTGVAGTAGIRSVATAPMVGATTTADGRAGVGGALALAAAGSGAVLTPAAAGVGAVLPPGAATAGAPAQAAGAAGAGAHDHGATTDPAMPAAPQCKLVVKLDPRDEMLTDEPLKTTAGLENDLLMPQIVLDWMDENQFAEAHDGWHLVRKWDQTCRESNAPPTCATAQNLVQQGLQRAPIQQGAPGDGLAFMMMHRHMMMMLQTAFPKHPKLFAGFKKVPRMTSDSENPMPWHEISWSADNLTGFDILENIEQHLDMFPTDDDLGQFIENTYKWTTSNPTSPLNKPGSGLHGALHAQWSVFGSPATLIDQTVDVKNYTFWKLHGWIDDVWARYRKAKNLSDDDPAYRQLMLDQCNEMWSLEPRNRNMPNAGNPTGGSSGSSGTTAPETGYFATMVRPFLDTTCGGCHSAVAPNAGLTLGGSGVASANVIKNIVGVKATNGEFNLIEPGNPMRSWIYLKASGDSLSVTCTGMCDREKMPPSGNGLSAAQLMTLQQWITNGATSN